MEEMKLPVIESVCSLSTLEPEIKQEEVSPFTDETSPMYQCPFCHFRANQPFLVRIHLNHIHCCLDPESLPVKMVERTDHENRIYPAPKVSIPCTLCNSIFSSHLALSRHKQLAHCGSATPLPPIIINPTRSQHNPRFISTSQVSPGAIGPVRMIKRLPSGWQFQTREVKLRSEATALNLPLVVSQGLKVMNQNVPTVYSAGVNHKKLKEGIHLRLVNGRLTVSNSVANLALDHRQNITSNRLSDVNASKVPISKTNNGQNCLAIESDSKCFMVTKEDGRRMIMKIVRKGSKSTLQNSNRYSTKTVVLRKPVAVEDPDATKKTLKMLQKSLESVDMTPEENNLGDLSNELDKLLETFQEEERVFNDNGKVVPKIEPIEDDPSNFLEDIEEKEMDTYLDENAVNNENVQEVFNDQADTVQEPSDNAKEKFDSEKMACKENIADNKCQSLIKAESLQPNEKSVLSTQKRKAPIREYFILAKTNNSSLNEGVNTAKKVKLSSNCQKDSNTDPKREVKTKKSKKNKESLPVLEKSPMPKRSKIFVDPKLALIPDDNPYVKKAQSYRRNKRSIVEASQPFELAKEKEANESISLLEPYCNVCQILMERTGESQSDTQKGVTRIPRQSVVWLPQIARETDNAGSDTHFFPVSKLLVCSTCKVCVHAACYRTSPEDSAWTCDRCQSIGKSKKSQLASCMLCSKSEGLLRRLTSGSFVHLKCVILIPECRDIELTQFDAEIVPKRRWKVSCLICGISGKEPGVHCMASKSCMLSFHPSCAVANNVNIALGPDKDMLIRCNFCVEKYGLLNESVSVSKFQAQDIPVGTKVTVLEDSEYNGLVATVEATRPEEVHSVAFDDGSFCDTIQLGHVKPIRSKELSLNGPVSVKWEGKWYSGVYKGCNTLLWYQVRVPKVEELLEMDRTEIEPVNRT